MLSKIKFLIILAIGSAAIFYCTNRTIFSLAKIISYFSPCEKNLTTSYPCHAGYDIAVLLICTVIFTFSVGAIIIKIARERKNRLR